MTVLWNGLRDFPGTPAKIFAGIVCELLYVVVLLFCIATNRFVNLELSIALGSVVLAFNGITTWQFGTQRKTDYGYIERKAQGPSPVNVEAPAQVNVTAEQPAEAPKVEVQPLLSQPVTRRMPVPLTHRESEAD